MTPPRTADPSAKFIHVTLDTEFTELSGQAELISLGMVCAETGATFYAESADVDLKKVNPWIQKHVVPYLRYAAYEGAEVLDACSENCRATRKHIRKLLEQWLEQQVALSRNTRSSEIQQVRIISDVYAYDWVLFCDLFGGARELPPFINYIPLDLATMFYMRGLDPDLSRRDFAGSRRIALLDLKGSTTDAQHNALSDALEILACAKQVTGI